MFNEVVQVGPGPSPSSPGPLGPGQGDKTTQTGECDGRDSRDAVVELSAAGPVAGAGAASGPLTCQELLALSGALSAALPTGQTAINSLFSTLGKGVVIGDTLKSQQQEALPAAMPAAMPAATASCCCCCCCCGSPHSVRSVRSGRSNNTADCCACASCAACSCQTCSLPVRLSPYILLEKFL